MTITVKRVYLPGEPADGRRVLADRYWPRGLRKADARIDAWMRELAPSRELITWFGHRPERWEEFERRYRAELAGSERQGDLARLRNWAREGALTLVFSARDEERNNAVVLASVLGE